jgi:ribosomal protein S18 acetylase RimI-like enzyme
MTIRQLHKEDDLTDLIALSRSFFDEYANFHPEFFNIDTLRDDDIVAYFRGSVLSENGASFVAVEGDTIIGYITVFLRDQEPFWAVKRIGVISGLMVNTDHRRRGVASALLAAAKGFFESGGVNYFTVYTAATNGPAIAFYERRGLSPLHTTLIGSL